MPRFATGDPFLGAGRAPLFALRPAFAASGFAFFQPAGAQRFAFLCARFAFGGVERGAARADGVAGVGGCLRSRAGAGGHAERHEGEQGHAGRAGKRCGHVRSSL